MTSTLRHARPDEAEALVRLQEASAVEGFSNVFPPGRYPFPREEILESWHELLGRDDVVALVAEDGGELLGFAVLRCSLWVLEANERARSFYVRRGWRPNGDTRVVPFPPRPLDVGYTIDF